MIAYNTIRTIGFFGINLPTQPLLNGIAFVAAVSLLYFLAKRYKLSDTHVLVVSGIILVFGMALGSRVFYYFGPWGNQYSFGERFLNVFDYNKPGMVYLGGVIFSILFGYLYCLIVKIDFWKYLDFFMIGAPLGDFIGRIGCYLYGCCFGKETHVPWAVIREGVPIHPTQIYLSLAGLFLFIMMIHLSEKNLKNKVFHSGVLACVYLMSYSILRFIIEFFRGDYKWHYLGLSLSQYVCIGMFLFFGAILYFRLKK